VILFIKNSGENFMNWFLDLITNPYIITAVSSWALAQVVKLFIYWGINKKFDIWRLFGDGGMPSGHSATVASLAAICCLLDGPASFQFAISFILAIIVCHDATGVRWETGKQAVVINQLVELIEKISDHSIADDVKLKEFVGHTYTQVIAGVILGIANALLLYFLAF
jgi:acid phosphatase family membrane protein YuiD